MRNQPTILIADDEAAIAEMVAAILRDEGYDVYCVPDGAGVLLAIEIEVPDLIILDNTMPLMTGLEVLRALRARGFQQPIVMMSALRPAQRFEEQGANGFLAKPFTLDALVHAVAWHLGR